ncbi:MAG: C4-type zinc ribbon domain-containing protein, partial [Candidatus Omnitrophota bacterium]|nr:C4-type zinc ribbon domain-containing protein [Candidatus Omnitrophota bacterium]
ADLILRIRPNRKYSKDQNKERIFLEPKSIKEQIGLLIDLQVIDAQIYDMSKERASMPGYLKSIDDALELKKTNIKQAEENLKNIHLKQKEKEGNLQQKEEQIKKLQGQLYMLKTNKEYSTMLAEIEGVKADNSLIEEDIIKLMDEIELAKKKISEEKEIFKTEEANAQKEKEIINLKSREIETKLSELNEKRNTITPNMEKQILSRYEKILKNKDGLAIVYIEENSCGGCHMNLPPQVISEVKLREDIVVCGSCLRILYIEDNVEIN